MRIFGRELALRRTTAVADAAAEVADELIETKSTVAAVGLREMGFLGFVRESFAGAWQRSLIVDDRQTMLANSAVFSCVSRISTDIAKLDICLQQVTDEGVWVNAPDNSPFWKVLKQPNSYENLIQFLLHWLASKLIFGNTYVLLVQDGRQMVTAAYILDARRVTPLVTPDGDVYYQCAGDNLNGIAAGITVPASAMIHDRGQTLFHPLAGVSPLYACALSATQASRIQRNSSRFFENMSRPSGMLTAPKTITKETAARLKEDWEKNYSGENVGRLAILGDGLKYEAMTIPPEQAQMVEQLGWTVEDIARAFSMPLYKINSGPMPTNNNVEALQQQYYNDCLQINMTCIEKLLTAGLRLQTGYRMAFDLDGLMRMDTLMQYETLAKGVGGTILKPNEARRKLNLPPVAGGDTVYSQQQNYSLAALDRRDRNAAAPAAPALGTPAAPAAPAPPAAKDMQDDLEAQAAQMTAQFLDSITKALNDAPAAS